MNGARGLPSAWSHPLALALLFLFPVGWTFAAERRLSVPVLGFMAVWPVACLAVGSLLLRYAPLRGRGTAGLPTRLVFGFVGLSAFLYLSAWLSPFGLRANSLVLVGIAALLCWALKVNPFEQPEDREEDLTGLLAVAVCLVAATLWSRDSLSPIETGNGQVVFKPWLDSFFHARQISLLAHSHGANTIQDIQMAGSRMFPYHQAAYILPAALTAFTATHSYFSFTSFLIPLGLSLSGLSAYVLLRHLLGPWEGLAAAAALMLLPDASQVLVHNPWLSYHWLQQVGPAGPYAVAVLAMAWLFMIDGCESSRHASILVGFALAALCILYKAQLFVASAFLVWMFPAVFMKGTPSRSRAVWALAALVLFVAGVKAAERLPMVPVIRLDGSALPSYPALVISMFENRPLQSFFSILRYAQDGPLHVKALWVGQMALLFLVCTFGVVGAGLLVLGWRARRDVDRMILLLPLLVVANYVVMALFLALDDRKIGRPEELLHRPFVWAYFVVCTWAGALACRAFLERPRPRSLRWLVAALAIGLVLVPYRYGRRIQVGPSWGSQRTWNAVPAGLVEACSAIRDRSTPDDVVQDSGYDSVALVSALTERQAFVIDNQAGLRQPRGLPERVDALRRFAALKSDADLRAFLKENGIDWYLLRPGDLAEWATAREPVFSSDGYRVYRFERRRAGG